MVRFLSAVGLSLLLLGLQQESLLHGLQHDRAYLADARDTVLSTADSGPCLLCTLLAGGTHAVPSAASIIYATPQAIAPRVGFGTSVAVVPPVFYASRAPPSIFL